MKAIDQTGNELWISAGLAVTEGTDPEVAYAALSVLVGRTQQEPGCLRFELLRHQQTPGAFTLWEGWVNEAALQAHFQAEHTLAYLAREMTDVVYIERLEPPVTGLEKEAV